MTDGIALEVFRLDPERDKSPRFDRFHVAARPGLTVLEALLEVLDYQDASLAFRYCCRGAVCGSCAMYINGSYRLACQTQVDSFGKKPVRISPLPHLPIVRDLVVDMTTFFEKYERIMPYLEPNSQPQAGIEVRPQEREWRQSPTERRKLDEKIDCILCAACYSACPMSWTNPDYLGPAAFNAAYRFIVDSRDKAAEERLALVAHENGIWRCHTVFNCVEACPKDCNQTDSIQRLKRMAVTHKLRSLAFKPARRGEGGPG